MQSVVHILIVTLLWTLCGESLPVRLVSSADKMSSFAQGQLDPAQAMNTEIFWNSTPWICRFSLVKGISQRSPVAPSMTALNTVNDIKNNLLSIKQYDNTGCKENPLLHCHGSDLILSHSKTEKHNSFFWNFETQTLHSYKLKCKNDSCHLKILNSNFGFHTLISSCAHLGY